MTVLRTLLLRSLEHHVVEHLLHAALCVLALLAAHQDIDGGQGRASPQQLLNERLAEEARGAGYEDVLLVIELLDGCQVRGRYYLRVAGLVGRDEGDVI